MIIIAVDLQNDFITGFLKVNGAEKACDNLLQLIWKNTKEISKIIFTVDWHPVNHCSFSANGGEWPRHCIQYTEGASISEKVIINCIYNNIPYEIVTKGTDPSKEEYGAFSNSIPNITEGEEVVVCGIAGDYCVLHTLENILHLKPKVFLDGIASIDGGEKLKKFIKENDLDIFNYTD